MEPTSDFTVLAGDCIKSMAQLPDNSVHCCVTSPPYFGLRDYGTAKWEGGDPNCDHIRKHAKHGGERADRDQSANVFQYKGKCEICGATSVDDQIGQEQTPDDFVAKMVEVFEQVRRVLRPDGTLWLNLGDSYNGSGGQGTKPNIMSIEAAQGRGGKSIQVNGLKQKDLIGIPWMVAFALRKAGWYLRQDIIWHKPNPMPESVQDRCTKAHEYIFLMTKSPSYYYDIDAIREPWKQNPSDIKRAIEKHPGYAAKHDEGYNGDVRGQPVGDPTKGRNKRSVWTVTTKPYKGAHFATFPRDLIEPCILAGCPVGGVVLDPFGGSGTTAEVSLKHRRKAILCELNPEYIKLIHQRMNGLQINLI